MLLEIQYDSPKEQEYIYFLWNRRSLLLRVWQTPGHNRYTLCKNIKADMYESTSRGFIHMYLTYTDTTGGKLGRDMVR